MTKPLIFFCVVLMCTASRAGEHQTPGLDSRIDLGLTAEERTEFLTEMRTCWRAFRASCRVSVRTTASGSPNPRASPATAWRGPRPSRCAPSCRRRSATSAGPTHMLFEELAVRAETDDMDSLASAAAVIMNQCLACHATFRVH